MNDGGCAQACPINGEVPERLIGACWKHDGRQRHASSNLAFSANRGCLAQLTEQPVDNRQVAGLSPGASTRI